MDKDYDVHVDKLESQQYAHRESLTVGNLDSLGVGHLDGIGKVETTDSDRVDNEHIAAFTPAEQTKIIRRIDRRLVLTLGFMYCVSLMDRTNTGIAAIAGMAVDLDLISNRYSIIVLVFFITYVILQPPATVLLRKIGPRKFLPLITLLWGLTMMSMGFLRTWTQMVGLRIILGVFEAGFFPGMNSLDKSWICS